MCNLIIQHPGKMSEAFGTRMLNSYLYIRIYRAAGKDTVTV